MSRAGNMTYVPLYFEEFKGGCGDLSNEQIGVYLRVLFEIYDAMGPIKFDERRLAKRLNCRPHKARAMIGELITMGKLYLTAAGQISNHRAEHEITKFISISVQNRLNASSPRNKSNSAGKTRNEINARLERPPSDRSAILDNRIQNSTSTTSKVVGAETSLGSGGASRPLSPAVQGFISRTAQRQRRGTC